MSRKRLIEACIGCGALFAAPPAVAEDEWTSINLGINAGFVWGTQAPLNLLTNNLSGPTFDFNGALVGGLVGASIQNAHVVLGIEVDLDWLPVSATSHLNGRLADQAFESDVDLDMEALFTGRVRAGYADGDWLFFATGGLAVIRAETSLTNLLGVVCGSQETIRCSGPKWRVGAVAGAGVEYMFMPNFSLRVEYLHAGGVALELTRLNEIRAAVNWHFGGI
jgi:high affinity Mn2+ porin